MVDAGKISPSKLTTYKGCSFAYWLQYVQHEKVSESVRLTFGRTIHHLLDKFYDLNFKTDESFAGYWRRYWSGTLSGEFLRGKEKENLKLSKFKYFAKDENGKKIEKEMVIRDNINLGEEPVGVFFGYMRAGESILKRFYKRHKNKPAPIEREKRFGFRKDETIEINGHLVIGVIDRIDEMNGDVFITDYKTDKNSPGQNSFVLHRNPQFTFYSYVYRKLFANKEKSLLYYHLRSGDVFKTHRSERDYEYIKRLIDEVAIGIEKNIFIPFYGFHCNFCDYQSACEKYSIPHHGGPRIDLEGRIIGAEKFNSWDFSLEVPDWIEAKSEER